MQKKVKKRGGLPKKVLSLLTVTALLCSMPTSTFAAVDSYGYDEPGDRSGMPNTNVLERYGGTNNYSKKIKAERAQAKAAFTTESRTVSAVKDEFWDGAEAYPIEHAFPSDLKSNEAPGGGYSFR